MAYDVAADKFTPTTTAGLTPTCEAIFAGAPADAAGRAPGFQEWAPILQVFLGGFARPGNFDLSYGYEFADMVPAYEARACRSVSPAPRWASPAISSSPAASLFVWQTSVWRLNL